MNMRNGLIVIGGGFTYLLIIFIITQSNLCGGWYSDLGNRLDALHERAFSLHQTDPGNLELVNDYIIIHQETDKFNTECGVFGYNIPMFSD